MTANQINYARAQEERRHNLAEEGVKGREASVKERTLGESMRANREQELINWFATRGGVAAQLAQAGAAQSQAAASHRQAGVAESRIPIYQQQADTAQYEAETRRAQASETGRHNVETERQGRTSLKIQSTQAINGLAQTILRGTAMLLA